MENVAIMCTVFVSGEACAVQTMRPRGQEWMLAWYTQQFISFALFQCDGHMCSWQNLFASDALLKVKVSRKTRTLIKETPHAANYCGSSNTNLVLICLSNSLRAFTWEWKEILLSQRGYWLSLRLIFKTIKSIWSLSSAYVWSQPTLFSNWT